MSLVLRPLVDRDLDLAERLHRQAFEPMGERGWTRGDFAGLLATPGVSGFVAMEAGEATGFVLARLAADEAELLTLAVDPRRRRCGTGRALLDAVLAWVRAAGVRTLYLEVGADNLAAQHLYRRRGFADAGRRPGYYRRGDAPPADAVVMRFALS